MVSMELWIFSFDSYSSVILLIPWIMVEWSLPPKREPILSKDASVIFLDRYMAICLGFAISLLLLLDLIWSKVIPKCSQTTSMISCGVISFGLSGEMMFCNSSIATSMVICLCSKLEYASNLFKAPSSSRILDLILVAM